MLGSTTPEKVRCEFPVKLTRNAWAAL